MLPSEPGGEDQGPRRRGVARCIVWPALACLAALGLGLWAWRAGWLDLFGDLPRLRSLIVGLGPQAALAIVLLNAAQAILAPLPGYALNLVSGYLFGPWLGTLYTLIGAVGGSLIVLALVRAWGRPLAARLVGEKHLARMDRALEGRGAFFLLLIFLLPFLPDDLACIAAGLTPLPLYQIVCLQVIGRTPGLFVANLIGYYGRDLTIGQWALFGAAITTVALLFWRFRPSIERAFMRLAGRLSGR